MRFYLCLKQLIPAFPTEGSCIRILIATLHAKHEVSPGTQVVRGFYYQGSGYEVTIYEMGYSLERINFSSLLFMPNSDITFSVQQCPDGGFEARALDYSIFTQARSVVELKAKIADALACHFEEPHFSVLKFSE
ncbi:MAG: hypothetical protein NVS9B14_23710 [Candidatus Acidiferrum sp.]